MNTRTEHSARLWAGIDVGKGHHWVCVVDDAGSTRWSAKVDNDETTILNALAEVAALADQVDWGVDITGTAPYEVPRVLVDAETDVREVLRKGARVVRRVLPLPRRRG